LARIADGHLGPTATFMPVTPRQVDGRHPALSVVGWLWQDRGRRVAVRLTAFLCREEPALHLRDRTGKVSTSIKAFPENLELVENELIPLPELGDPFKAMAEKFCQLLEEFRLLACGQLISRAVAELGKPDVAGNVHAALQHLIVDEYQNVNPAHERLIRLLAGWTSR
jgi:DNA helicase-2/ATP-dependent DNA helicase PcrA